MMNLQKASTTLNLNVLLVLCPLSIVARFIAITCLMMKELRINDVPNNLIYVLTNPSVNEILDNYTLILLFSNIYSGNET